MAYVGNYLAKLWPRWPLSRAPWGGVTSARAPLVPAPDVPDDDTLYVACVELGEDHDGTEALLLSQVHIVLDQNNCYSRGIAWDFPEGGGNYPINCIIVTLSIFLDKMSWTYVETAKKKLCLESLIMDSCMIEHASMNLYAQKLKLISEDGDDTGIVPMYV